MVHSPAQSAVPVIYSEWHVAEVGAHSLGTPGSPGCRELSYTSLPNHIHTQTFVCVFIVCAKYKWTMPCPQTCDFLYTADVGIEYIHWE